MIAVNRRNRHAGLQGRDQCKRGHCERKHGKEGRLVGMRDKHSYSPAVNHPGKGADHVVYRSLERSSNAHLAHDDRREDCPERQRELQ